MKNRLKKKNKFLIFHGVSKPESSDRSWIKPSNLMMFSSFRFNCLLLTSFPVAHEKWFWGDWPSHWVILLPLQFKVAQPFHCQKWPRLKLDKISKFYFVKCRKANSTMLKYFLVKRVHTNGHTIGFGPQS